MDTMRTDHVINALCDADYRSTLTHRYSQPNLIVTYPSTEVIIESHIAARYDPIAHEAITKLVDPVDLYMWSALAESELATIRLIESMRTVEVVA